MMRKYVYMCLCVLILLSATVSASAYVFPSDYEYAVDGRLDSIRGTFYFQYNYADYIVDGINTYSSQISCYFQSDGGAVYNVRFPSFDNPTYRPADSDYYVEWDTATTWVVDDIPKVFENYQLIIIAVLFVILLCLLFFKGR